MKKIFFAILLFLNFGVLKAQFDAQFSQYWACKNYYNPASVGSIQSANATLINKQQWVGIPNAPKSFFVSMDMPIAGFGKKHGIGVNLLSDKIGLFNNSSVMIDYAFKIQKWGGTISLGTQLGLINESFDGTKINIGLFEDPAHDKVDPSIPITSVQAMSFDMGVGGYFSTDKFYVGLSVTHLMQPTIDFDEKSSTFVGRQMYLTGGTSFALEESKIVFYPSVLAKTDFRFSQVDLTMRAELDERFWGGLSYRWNNAVVVLLGVRMKNIALGYAYDISTSKLFSVNGGSHELFASYNFEIEIQHKTTRKINKSLRYL
jgi:type IX secretion system PorP/SprF family membrane protein